MEDGRDKYLRFVAGELGRARMVWRGIPTAILVFALIVCAAELAIVNYRLPEIPEDIANYMLYTVFYRFDQAEFRAVCLVEGVPETRIEFFLFVYYSFHAFVLIVPVLFFWLALGGVVRPALYRDRELFSQVMELHDCVEALALGARSSTKRRAIRLARSLHLAEDLSPLKRRWQEKPRFDWFSLNPLPRDVIRVLASLELFPRKAATCLEKRQNLPELARAVDSLATYLYLSNVRKHAPQAKAREEISAEEGFRVLVGFADALSRIQGKRSVRKGFFHRLEDLAHELAAREAVRVLAAIAIVAAAFMIAGSAVFGIPPRTAFLTWFSVVFGSATVTLGTSAFLGRRVS